MNLGFSGNGKTRLACNIVRELNSDDAIYTRQGGLTDEFRAAYGRTSKEIFYQQGGQVWLLSKGVRSAIAPLEERGVQ